MMVDIGLQSDISNSFIINWGNISTTTIIFPLSFTNTQYKVTRAWYMNTQAGNIYYNAFGVTSKSKTSCETRYDSRYTNQEYIAVGY